MIRYKDGVLNLKRYKHVVSNKKWYKHVDFITCKWYKVAYLASDIAPIENGCDHLFFLTHVILQPRLPLFSFFST